MLRNDRAATLAAAMLRFRRERAAILPSELFAEPAWDMLLELFVADAEGQRLTARAVSDRSRVPPAVMARWLIHLTKIGFVVGDGEGDLDDLLTLSGVAMERMEQVLAEAAQLQTAIG